MKIEYRKGDLFEAAGPNRLLVHACNCRGAWGSGVAVGFRQAFPDSYNDYKKLCIKHGDNLLGMGISYFRPPNGQRVGYLFTSRGYGNQKDPERIILKATKTAVECLLQLTPTSIEIHSPKINSGLFAVPWEKTEKIIEDALKVYGHKWVVWEQE